VLAGCTGGTDAPIVTPTLPEPSLTTVSAPDPQETARAFLEAWKARSYEAMYDLLSPLSQDALTREDFVRRYEEIWQRASLTGVDYEIISALVNPQAAQVRYQVTLSSAYVGDIMRDTSMELKRVGDEWRVAWSESAILPELTGGNGLTLVPVTPTRANIYDRNGLGLAVQTNVVALWIVPGLIGDEDAETTMLETLGRLLDRRPEDIAATYENALPDWFIPVGEASLDEFQRVQGTLEAVGGVQWAVYEGRFYYRDGVTAHAVGYVAQIGEEQLAAYREQGYQGDEFVGQIGVEAGFESELRGKPGGTLYLSDASGRTLNTMASRDPEPPLAVYTNLDRNLQFWAQRSIEAFDGAVVVLERDTGAVLAMASSPGFDPNLFDARNPNSGPGLQQLFSGVVNQPLVNRATSGGYPLGSVFKIITMAAGLESGYYTPSTLYTCNGLFTELPGVVLQDWTVAKELPDHGEVTLLQGLERSCNPYFWHIGLDLFNRGLPSALPDMARGFGLGQATGIEIGDAAGILPDPEWKRVNLGEDWTAGDSVQLAIGQASLNVTPIQVARFAAAVGNGGTLYRPQIIQRVQTGEGTVLTQFAPETQGTLPVTEENLAAIQQAMVQVVRSERGTARRTFLGRSDINIAGKTGTAESGAADPHAWFAGYTFEGREDKPDIAIAVLLEYQGEGSEWAAPVFLRLVETYFYGEPFTRYPWEARVGVPAEPTPTPGPEELTPTDTPEP
jgi:penicillin-binding protein 2